MHRHATTSCRGQEWRRLFKRPGRMGGDEVPTALNGAKEYWCRGVGMVRQDATIAIVDSPDSQHGQLMKGYAQVGEFTPMIQWIRPSLHLPHDLTSLDGVAAVAVPLGVRGATAQDRFTLWVMDAIHGLMARHIPVFVAAGNRRPNLLAKAGIAVSISDVPGSTSTSEACVRAAAQAASRSPCNRNAYKLFQN
jgi:hypothetical protein